MYDSHDSVDDDATNNYPLDFLSSITPNGLPLHELKIKKNCPIILPWNLDPYNGLCNGTRLVARGFENNSMLRLLMGSVLAIGFSFQGYLCPHIKTLPYHSNSKGGNFLSDSDRGKLFQMWVYTFLNLYSLMDSYTLHCLEVLHEILRGFWPNLTLMPILLVRELRTLCIRTCWKHRNILIV